MQHLPAVSIRLTTVSRLLAIPLVLSACAKDMGAEVDDSLSFVDVTSDPAPVVEPAPPPVDGSRDAPASLEPTNAPGTPAEERSNTVAVEMEASDDVEVAAAAEIKTLGTTHRARPRVRQSKSRTTADMYMPSDAGRGAHRRAGARPMKKSKRARARSGAVVESRHQVVATAPAPAPTHHTEAYDHIQEREFAMVKDAPLSTFSVDVDTAAYANMRRFLNHGQLPPADAVRVEELVNYFDYNYPTPRGNAPFAVNAEVSDCPWNDEARLVQIGIKGKEFTQAQTPRRNLVFLLDVSGSMNSPDKLPLLKKALGMLVDNLEADDMVSIVVYAGASGVVLNPTSGEDKAEIMGALDRLRAGGSTNGASGIELAYRLAQQNFDPAGINRVILATDGDFNVGNTSRGELTRLIERKRAHGVFLSVLGFGTGNVKDSTMEMLADKGNGNYAYIDSVREARKVLVEEAGGTLVTIAKDVKIQVEFNPTQVASYRLVGYENRALANRDFNDDTKDAGEIGAGHTVTAMYEVIPADGGDAPSEVDPLRYQSNRALDASADSDELLHLKLRYKAPQGRKSKLISYAVRDQGDDLTSASEAFRFAASVTSFALLLRGSPHARETSMGEVYALASGALGRDDRGYRGEFLNLVRTAAQLRGESLGTVATIAR